MNTKVLLTVFAGLAFGLVIVMIGCTDSNNKKLKTDSVTDTIIDEFVDTTFESIASDPTKVSSAVDTEPVPGEVTAETSIENPSGPAVYDMIIKDDCIYAIVDDGILVHNLVNGENLIIATDEPVGAILDLGEKILVGTSSIYTLDGDMLSGEDYDLNLTGSITALHRRSIDLYIGTTDGLYQLSIGGLRELAQDIHVSAITSDMHGGLWVGTAGDGLYRWDGDRFQKRYLRRDSTLFANVTALDYNHEHLYLGTDRGFFVFDGGRWQAYDLADGLPSEVITAVNAREWVIKVGTSNGPATFFNNEFKPMSRFVGISVTRIEKYDKRIIAATSNAGLLMSSSGLITTLYDQSTNAEPLALEDAL
jgi:hypothetical protein